MAFYVDKDLGQGTVTSKDYDLYCHYGECSAATPLSLIPTHTAERSQGIHPLSFRLRQCLVVFIVSQRSLMSCYLMSSLTHLLHSCDAVAGLVGEGLSRLFACTGYEKQEVADVSKTLANTMGLLLQKTNIIRDYLEDYVDGRAFWPQEVRTNGQSPSSLLVEVFNSTPCV